MVRLRLERVAPPKVPVDVELPTTVAFALAIASTDTDSTPTGLLLETVSPAVLPFLDDWIERSGFPRGSVLRVAERLKPEGLDAGTARDWVDAVARALKGGKSEPPRVISTVDPAGLVSTLEGVGVRAFELDGPFQVIAGSGGESALFRLVGRTLDAVVVREGRRVASELGARGYLVPSGDLEDPVSGPVAVPLDRVDVPGPGEWLLPGSDLARVGVGLSELFSGF